MLAIMMMRSSNCSSVTPRCCMKKPSNNGMERDSVSNSASWVVAWGPTRSSTDNSRSRARQRGVSGILCTGSGPF